MTDISTAAVTARENARQTSGRFGEQEHTAPDLTLTSAGTEPIQWTREADAAGDFESILIASGTNPWLQVDGKPVNLTALYGTGTVDYDVCDGCAQGDFAGIVLAMDSGEGIQRCDGCQKFDGDLEAAQATADVLTRRTGKQHTVWFEPEAPAAEDPAPFVWDNNYRNDEQVRPYMDDFLRVYAELDRGRGFVYNDDFRGRIPALAGEHEDTGIYMLQNLKRLDELEVTKAEFLASGGRKVEVSDLTPGQTLRGTVVHAGFYMGGTGWQVREGARLRILDPRPGYECFEVIEKGKRRGSMIRGGDVYIREA